jgi:hypothetical protein
MKKTAKTVQHATSLLQSLNTLCPSNGITALNVFSDCFSTRPVKGIHIVVLHVSYGDLSFAVGYRIFEAKNKLTPIELALDLLKSWSPRRWGGWDVRLIADSGFISQAFVEQTHKLGFVHVGVGGKNNLVHSHQFKHLVPPIIEKH